MYPHPIHLFGAEIAIWNVLLLLGICVGYLVLRAVPWPAPAGPPRWLFARWMVTVYVGAVSAQVFAYLFDLNTTVAPPPDVSMLRYYFDPLFGPKTLYGAIITLPLAMLLIVGSWSRERYVMMLDRWTPAMMTTLALARVGCFLQGCCYGRRHEWLGVVFPYGSPVYWRQVQEGAIVRDAHALPVVPAQLFEAVALFVMAAWSFTALRRGTRDVFVHGVALYSGVRFALEFLRDDPERNGLAAFSTSQWIALAILVIYGVWRVTRQRPRVVTPSLSH